MTRQQFRLETSKIISSTMSSKQKSQALKRLMEGTTEKDLKRKSQRENRRLYQKDQKVREVIERLDREPIQRWVELG
jgi:hypothetical protein